MSSILNTIRRHDFTDTALRTALALSFAFVLYLLVEGWLW